MHTRFRGPDVELLAERKHARRVTPETAHDFGIGIKGLVEHAHSRARSFRFKSGVARGNVQGFRRRIVGKTVLQVRVFIYLAYEGNRLASGTKCPLDGHFQLRKEEFCQRMFCRRPKRAGVATGSMLGKLGGMAATAGLAAHIVFFRFLLTNNGQQRQRENQAT